MQNIPAQGKMGKLVKSCFRAPPESYYLHKGIWVAEMCLEFPTAISRELDKLEKLGGYRTTKAFKAQARHIAAMPDCTPEILEALKENIVYDPGWLFVGLDYASLEDRINTLLTKDKNKLAVYLDGFDGHCLRAAAYSADVMPDITAAREEISKQGQTYKVVYSDGTVEYFNEHNPTLARIRNGN